MSSYSQLHAGRSNLGASAATHSPTPTNAYAASTYGIIPLDDGSQDITLNFSEWKKSVLRFFMGLGRGLDQNFGFASQILSLTEYQRLPGNVLTTPGIVGNQKPTLRLQPIANGDTGGTLEKKKVNNKKLDEMQSELMHARNILIDSLGPVAAKTVELRDDSYGQITSTCRAIMRQINMGHSRALKSVPSLQDYRYPCNSQHLSRSGRTVQVSGQTTPY